MTEQLSMYFEARTYKIFSWSMRWGRKRRMQDDLIFLLVNWTAGAVNLGETPVREASLGERSRVKVDTLNIQVEGSKMQLCI